MSFGVMLGTDAVEPNLIFFHRGVINPHSGIGEHFHNRCEEMFVILNGEAQFTIDGRTALIQGPRQCLTAWAMRTASITPPTNRWSG